MGYLRKKGHVRRNWLDRWFVLTTEGMYYYKNRTVSQCPMRRVSISFRQSFKGRRNCCVAGGGGGGGGGGGQQRLLKGVPPK